MSSNSSGYRVRRHLSFVDLPYRGKRFYLDIKAASVKSRISERIINLGGHIETFLSKDLSLLITDRDTDKPQATKQLGLSNSSIPLSRGQALLLKAAENHQSDSGSSHDLLRSASKLGIKTQTASLFIKTSAKLLSKIKKKPGTENDVLSGMSPISWDKDKENLYTLKIEDSDSLYRPLFKQFDVVPSINYDDTESPFDVGVVLVKENDNNPTKKKTVTGAVKGGYCESCDHWYKCTLREHLNSNKHKQFVASLENFKSLDDISSQLPSLDGFLTRYGMSNDDGATLSSSTTWLPENKNSAGTLDSLPVVVVPGGDFKNKSQASNYSSQLVHKFAAGGNSSLTKQYPLTSDNQSLACETLKVKPINSRLGSKSFCQEDTALTVVSSLASNYNQKQPDLHQSELHQSELHSENVAHKSENIGAHGSQSGRSNKSFSQLSKIQCASKGSSVYSDRRITVDDVLKSVFDDDADNDDDDDSGKDCADMECEVVNEAVDTRSSVSASVLGQTGISPAHILTNCDRVAGSKSADTASESQTVCVSSSHNDRQVTVSRQNSLPFCQEATFSSSCSFGDMGVGNVISFLQSNDSRGSGEKIAESISDQTSVESFKGLGFTGLINQHTDNSAHSQLSVTFKSGQSQLTETLNDAPDNRSYSSSQPNFSVDKTKLDSTIAGCSDSRSMVTERYSFSNENGHSIDNVNEDRQTETTILGGALITRASEADNLSLPVFSSTGMSISVSSQSKPVNICNPDYSNITEESTSHEFPKIIDSLISLNACSQSPAGKKTPLKHQSDSLRKQILTNAANSGSTVRNWLVPHDDNASDISVLSADIGDKTLIEMGVDADCNPGNLHHVETGDPAGMVADWIKNQSFDTVSKPGAECDVELHDDAKKEVSVCETNMLIASEHDFDNSEGLGERSVSNLECEKLSDWSEGTSISDCTLSQFRLTHNIVETSAGYVGGTGLEPGLTSCQILSDSTSVKSGRSVKSSLSSCVTEKGIKIKGLLTLKNDNYGSATYQGSRSCDNASQDSQAQSSVRSNSDLNNESFLQSSVNSFQQSAPVYSDTRRVVQVTNTVPTQVSHIQELQTGKLTENRGISQTKGQKATKNKGKATKAKPKSRKQSKNVLDEPSRNASPLMDRQQQQLLSQQAYSPISMQSDGVSRFQFGSPLTQCPSPQLPYGSSRCDFEKVQSQQPYQPSTAHQPTPSQYTNTNFVAMPQSTVMQSMPNVQLNSISVDTNTNAYSDIVPDFLLSPQQQMCQQVSSQMKYQGVDHASFVNSMTNFLGHHPHQQPVAQSMYQQPTEQAHSTAWQHSYNQSNGTRMISPAPAGSFQSSNTGSLQTICLADIAEENSRDSAYNLSVKPVSAKGSKIKGKRSMKKASVHIAPVTASSSHDTLYGANCQQESYTPRTTDIVSNQFVNANGQTFNNSGVGLAGNQSKMTSVPSQPMGSIYNNQPASAFHNDRHTVSIGPGNGYNMNQMQNGYTSSNNMYLQHNAPNNMSLTSQYNTPGYQSNHNPGHQSLNAGYQFTNQSINQSQNTGYQLLKQNSVSQPGTFSTGSQALNGTMVQQMPNYSNSYQTHNQNTGYQLSSYNTNQYYNSSGNDSSGMYNAVATGETKLRLQRVPTMSASDQQNSLLDYWNVRKSGDCRLVFSTGVATKRKAEELMSPNCPSPYDTPMSGYKYSTDDTEPQSKRRRCLVY